MSEGKLTWLPTGLVIRGVRGQFWTDAERAGLKAMGLRCRAFKRNGRESYRLCTSCDIRAYVAAARAVKEGR